MDAVIPQDGLDPGVYFDLPESAYHNESALGSTDIRRLLTGPSEFHYGWVGNPDRDAQAEAEWLTFGRAVHKLVLEGRQSFEGLFATKPEGPDVLSTGEDMRAWLRAHGLSDKGTKEAMAERIAAVNPNVPIADRIAQVAIANGKTILPWESYKRILMAAKFIESMPDLARAFAGGRSEISVFWVRKGIRLKARFDYLRVIRHNERRCAVITDLKSFGRYKPGQPVKQAAREAAAGYKHQAAHYVDGLMHAKKMIAQGLVHGEADANWLQMVATAQTWLWSWVFLKSTGAGYVHGLTLSPENSQILEPARMDVDNALDTFRRYFEGFGHDGPWVEIDGIEELCAEDLPRWLL